MTSSGWKLGHVGDTFIGGGASLSKKSQRKGVRTITQTSGMLPVNSTPKKKGKKKR